MHEFYYFVDFVRDSKIMEYGIAFLFIGLFAVLYKLLDTPVVAHAAAAESVVSKALQRIKGLLVPEGVAFHRGHTWARLENANLATVGMDDFAAKLVGDIDTIELPAAGATLKQGEPAWTLVADGKRIPMLAPVDGKVVAINEAAARALGADPYGAGWLVKVESPKIKTSMNNLLTGLLARAFTEQSVDELFARAGAQLGSVAADGGAPVHGMARQIDAAAWEGIAREFFMTQE